MRVKGILPDDGKPHLYPNGAYFPGEDKTWGAMRTLSDAERAGFLWSGPERQEWDQAARLGFCTRKSAPWS